MAETQDSTSKSRLKFQEEPGEKSLQIIEAQESSKPPESSDAAENTSKETKPESVARQGLPDTRAEQSPPDMDCKQASPLETPYDIENNSALAGLFLPKATDPLPLKNSGLRRHRLIIAGCLLLSSVILFLNAINLKPLLIQDATLNSSDLSLTLAEPDGTLPANIRFASPVQEGLRIIVKDTWDGERSGFADPGGKVVIEPQFGTVGEFHEGLAAAAYPSDILDQNRYASMAVYGHNAAVQNQNLNLGFINKEGKWVIKPRFTRVSDFKDGVAAACWHDKSGRSFSGLIDSSGKIISQFKYDVLPVRAGDNYIVMAEYNRTGLIDKTGKWLIPPQFTNIIKKTAVQHLDNHYCSYAFSDQYDWQIQQELNEQNTSHLEAKEGGKSTLYDLNGNLLCEEAEEASIFHSKDTGILKFKQEEGWFNANGKKILKAGFSDVHISGKLIAAFDSHWHLFDLQGNEIKVKNPFWKPVFRNEKWFENGLAPVFVGNKAGYLNASGQLAIAPKFDFALPFQDGVAPVWTGDRWKLINSNGEIIPGLEFSKPPLFVDGRASVDKYGPLALVFGFPQLNYRMNSMKSWKEQNLSR